MRAVIVTLSTVDAYRVPVLKETGLAPCRLTERRARAELDARLCSAARGRARMSGPGTALRVLLVEDSENDALLLLDVLECGGYEPVYERVQTTEEMERALREASERRPWEVVLSDYYVPRFRASDALALLRRLGYDTPFAVVSGKIGEDAAVAMMRAGGRRITSAKRTRCGYAP